MWYTENSSDIIQGNLELYHLCAIKMHNNMSYSVLEFPETTIFTSYYTHWKICVDMGQVNRLNAKKLERHHDIIKCYYIFIFVYFESC